MLKLPQELKSMRPEASRIEVSLEVLLRRSTTFELPFIEIEADRGHHGALMDAEARKYQSLEVILAPHGVDARIFHL